MVVGSGVVVVVVGSGVVVVVGSGVVVVVGSGVVVVVVGSADLVVEVVVVGLTQTPPWQVWSPVQQVPAQHNPPVKPAAQQVPSLQMTLQRPTLSLQQVPPGHSWNASAGTAAGTDNRGGGPGNPALT